MLPFKLLYPIDPCTRLQIISCFLLAVFLLQAAILIKQKKNKKNFKSQPIINLEYSNIAFLSAIS